MALGGGGGTDGDTPAGGALNVAVVVGTTFVGGMLAGAAQTGGVDVRAVNALVTGGADRSVLSISRKSDGGHGPQADLIADGSTTAIPRA